MKFFLFLLFACTSFLANASIKEIPKSEFKKIKYLYTYLLTEHDFSYVVFGSKPMALADICLWLPDVPVYRRMHAEERLFKTKSALKAWYAYKQEFAFNEFILLDKEEDLFDCLVFVLIHKKNMLALLHKHQSIFKEKLGSSFEPEFFLKKIESRELSLAQAIHGNLGLLGIMLGYGVKNSMLYQERYEIRKAINDRKGLLATGNELEMRLKAINEKFNNFSEYEEFASIMPLHFCAVLEDEETKELKKQYTKDREAIQAIMKNGDLTDQAFEKMISQ